MMRLIALWELHSAMDRSGGDASELQSVGWKLVTADGVLNTYRLCATLAVRLTLLSCFDLHQALFSACEENNLEMVVRVASHDLVDVDLVRNDNGTLRAVAALLAMELSCTPPSCLRSPSCQAYVMS